MAGRQLLNLTMVFCVISALQVLVIEFARLQDDLKLYLQDDQQLCLQDDLQL